MRQFPMRQFTHVLSVRTSRRGLVEIYLFEHRRRPHEREVVLHLLGG